MDFQLVKIVNGELFYPSHVTTLLRPFCITAGSMALHFKNYIKYPLWLYNYDKPQLLDCSFT
jgi:hypothetical protein